LKKDFLLANASAVDDARMRPVIQSPLATPDLKTLLSRLPFRPHRQKPSDRRAPQLNIENIFNKGYWASADGDNKISPGAPRNVHLSTTASF
jgi:hypothetical protein